MAKKTHQKHSKVAKTASPAAGSIQKPSPAAGTERLGRWNLWIAAFCLLQALLVLLLAKDHVFPVQVSYPTPNPIESAIAGHQVITMASRHLFDVHLVYPVAYFLLVVAVVRGMCSTIFRFQYDSDLKKRLNILRWIGFGFSSALILLSLGLISGIQELSSLLLLTLLGPIGATAGLASEKLANSANKLVLRLLLCVSYGVIALAALALAAQVAGTTVFGGGSIPGYVYAIYASLAVFVAGGMTLHLLQLKNQGRWADYLRVEYGYIFLELLAVTATAWQLFAGALGS